MRSSARNTGGKSTQIGIHLFVVALGCLILGVGIAHEYIWRVRRNGPRIRGRMVSLKQELS